MSDWMIYGANGYSGAMIARAAAAAGMRPVLAGRNADAVAPIAAELGLAWRAFPADAPALDGIGLLLNCAGPFSATARPLIAAAIAARAHYLDITGEIEVFEHAATQDAAARAAGVVVCPGVGFDVVPTDCIAARLHRELPDATALALGFETRSALSPGTARTSIEGIGRGTVIRRGGRLRSEPIGWRTRRIDFGDGPRRAVAFPWGDVSTAYATTGIGDITVFVSVSPRMRRLMLLGLPFGPILRLPAVRRRLTARAAAIRGPDEARRAATPAFVWGEAVNATGETRVARVRTANSYDVTVHGALAVASRLRGSDPVAAGYATPSRLCGADLVERLPGSGRIEISRR